MILQVHLKLLTIIGTFHSKSKGQADLQNTAKIEALYAEGLWKGIAEWNLIVNRAPCILKLRP
jgi:hypothetical protein